MIKKNVHKFPFLKKNWQITGVLIPLSKSVSILTFAALNLKNVGLSSRPWQSSKRGKTEEEMA